VPSARQDITTVLSILFIFLDIFDWLWQSHLKHAVLNDEHIQVDLVLALGARRRRALVEVLVVKGIKIKIDLGPKPILIEVPALWALDGYLFRRRGYIVLRSQQQTARRPAYRGAVGGATGTGVSPSNLYASRPVAWECSTRW
jgi:hypothetical protein